MIPWIFWNCAQFSSAHHNIFLIQITINIFITSLCCHTLSHSSKFHYWRFWCLLWVNKRPNHIDYSSSLSSHNIKWQQRMFSQQSDKCVVALCSKITFYFVVLLHTYFLTKNESCLWEMYYLFQFSLSFDFMEKTLCINQL